MNLKKLTGVLAITIVSLLNSRAETVSIYDDSFIVNLPDGIGSGGILSGRWGTWDSGTQTFTQQITSSAAAGYVDLSVTPTELTITLNQTLNLGQTSGPVSGVYAPGTLLALAIFTDNGAADRQASNYVSTWARAILTDASWVSPTFANNANNVDFFFTANTTAVVGSYSFNGGNEVITLVPEPSTASLMMIGAAGLVALRRLRKV